MKIFEGMFDFFESIGEYVKNFSNLFWIFLGAFILVSVVVIVITSFAYECMLTKTVDRINKFLERNPRINDDNLVAFNNLMKASSVPKALRRQWQQFMLYREHPASYYMSFKHCVENPLRNSSYRQQMTVYKIISYILVVLSLVVSFFIVPRYQHSSQVFQEILIIPMTLLVIYWLVSMVLDLIHSAISADLFQNYQYFEINMDKAMLTLPEFVDYEVLFSQDEIRRGIPVLFAYLQKRAIQEQQELEKARLKSVDHEKFDFNEAGLDGSLVLDRAMRETENYTSQRKKYLQEIERINNEIGVLENNYKEQVKEYQRQVQTSKETVENLKEQLEQATSTIEINYIKKQMRDELNRQQMAEKDFDILTDKHNQEIKSLNQEIKHYEDETKKAKEAMETAMLSEFNTYSIKVYNNLEKIVDDKMQDRVDDYRDQIKGLEGQLEEKNEELENVYTRYQEVLSQVPAEVPTIEQTYTEIPTKKSKKKKKSSADDIPQDNGMVQPEQIDEPINEYAQPEYTEDYSSYENADNQQYDYAEGEQQYDYNYDTQQYAADENTGYMGEEYQSDEQYVPVDEQGYNDYYVPLTDEQNVDYNAEADYGAEYVPLAEEQYNEYNNDYVPSTEQETEQYPVNEDYLYQEREEQDDYIPVNEEYLYQEDGQAEDDVPSETFDNGDFDIDFTQNNSSSNLTDDEFSKIFSKEDEKPQQAVETLEDVGDDFDINKVLGLYAEDEKPAKKAKEEPKVELEEAIANAEVEQLDEDKAEDDSDILAELTAPKRKAGRPRKVVEEEPKPKRKAGRPRKVVDDTEIKPKRSVGRPKKQVDETEILEKPKRRAGRPRKVVEEEPKPKRKAGRPRKNVEIEPKNKVGRPKKSLSVTESKRKPGRPKKAEAESTEKRKVGRPRKDGTRKVGRPRKQDSATKTTGKRGRPRKN